MVSQNVGRFNAGTPRRGGVLAATKEVDDAASEKSH